MTVHTKRAALVIAILLTFTVYAIGRRVGLIVSGDASPMMVGFVAVDALHRLVMLVVASAMVWWFFNRRTKRIEVRR